MNPSGIAMGAGVIQTITVGGISIVGLRWIWNPGIQGGVFEPHLRRDNVAVFNPEGFVGDNPGQWGALPGEGFNRAHCMCMIRWILRGADGRFLPEKIEGR